MAKIRCAGCGQVQRVKTLGGIDGFARCPKCSALFDVTPAVESCSRRDAGFWAQGNIAEPPGVEVVLESSGTEAPKPAGGYRGNARVGEAEQTLTITCRHPYSLGRILGGIMLAFMSAMGVYLLVRESSTDTWVRVVVILLIGPNALVGLYLALVGLFNRMRIRVDHSFLRVDHGPLPFWNKKTELPIKDLMRLSCHCNIPVRGGRYHELWAWSRPDREDIPRRFAGASTLVEGLSSVTTALYLQQRIATFLGLDSSGPVDLLRKEAEADE